MDDAEAIESIGAAIQALRGRGRVGASAGGSVKNGLRLYRTRSGEFVRVLDDDAAPLTAAMVRTRLWEVCSWGNKCSC
jgi:hypothetical protein